jgi:deoxyribonuclease-4
MKIGFHVSIKGGIDKTVDRAKELKCNTFQMFTRSPRMWKARELEDSEIKKFREKISYSEISPIFSHMPYLSNLASPNHEIYEKSCNALKEEIKRCILLDVPYIVTHIGSHKGLGKEKGVKNVSYALNRITSELKSSPLILLENTSGKKHDIGSTFQEIREIIEQVNPKLGVCFDTCHAFARGYDLRSKDSIKDVIDAFDKIIGLKNLHLIHLNDSKGELGSRLDRHQHIGLGAIGEEGFRNILSSKLAENPMIMETPIDTIRGNEGNMSKALELAGLGVNK